MRVGRRLLLDSFILFSVACSIFFLFSKIGGDPVIQMLGTHASAAQITMLRHQYGFDQPLHIQFFHFLADLVHGHLGSSFATHQPIAGMFLDALYPTVFLGLPAFFISFLVSLAVAFACLRWQQFDRVLRFLSSLGISVPALVYILLGQYIFAYRLGIFPVSGFYGSILHKVWCITLPLIIYVLVSVGFQVQVMRSLLLQEMKQEYVLVAYARGLSHMRVFF